MSGAQLGARLLEQPLSVQAENSHARYDVTPAPPVPVESLVLVGQTMGGRPAVHEQAEWRVGKRQPAERSSSASSSTMGS